MIHIPHVQLKLFVQLMALRPLHCAHPVIPGRTSCRLTCSLLYRGKYCTNSGRGPINAISPFSTLTSCGSSSMLVERTNLPTLVNLCSSGRRLPSLSRSSVMVLNLITRKIFPLRPGRSWVKKAPAPLLAKCNQRVIRSSIGQMTANTQKTRMKSISLLKNVCTSIAPFQ